MKSWDNEDSISVFVFHVRKVFVPVVTENKTGTFFWDTLYMYYEYFSSSIVDLY